MELEKIIKNLVTITDEILSLALALVFLFLTLTIGLAVFTWYIILIISFAMLITIYEKCVMNGRPQNKKLK